MKHYQPCFALTLAFIRQTVLSNSFFLVILITTSTEKNNLNSSYSFFEGTEILLNKEHHCAYCFIAQEELLHLQLLFLTKNLTHIYSDFFIIALTHATMQWWAMMKQRYARLFSSFPLWRLLFKQLFPELTWKYFYLCSPTTNKK